MSELKMVSSVMMREVLAVLARSWYDIDYRYEGLTPTEQRLISRGTFEDVLDWIKQEGLDLMKDDPIKRADQIAMLKAQARWTDTGESEMMFSYPNCGYHLVQSGLVTPEGRITMAGRAALYLLKEGPDPTDGNSFQEFSIPINERKEG